MNNFELKKIKAIIGLGNPGNKYSKNRHNIGFRVVEAISDKFDGSWQERDNLDVSEIQISFNEELIKIILIKPQTFMNDSGCVIPFLLKKGIKPEEILVVHDELEKPFGKMIIKFDGSARGHNGLRSIIGMIGSNYWRLRFGIGRPEDKSQVSNYVLSNFTPDQESKIDDLIDESINLII